MARLPPALSGRVVQAVVILWTGILLGPTATAGLKKGDIIGLEVERQTPIWTTALSSIDTTRFHRFDGGDLGSVLDWWKENEYRHPTFYIHDSEKGKRSINENGNITDSAQLDIEVTRLKRSNGDRLEIGVLVVVDFQPGDDASPDAFLKNMKRKIVYAVAFFNGLNAQLRQTLNPKVYLRIAAIIVSKAKPSVKYLRKAMTDEKMNTDEALKQIINFWKSKAADTIREPGIPADAYHFVGVLTDSKQKKVEPGEKSWKYKHRDDPRNTTGFLFYDDGRSFSGLPAMDTMEEIGNMFKSKFSSVPLAALPPNYSGENDRYDHAPMPGQYFNLNDQCVKLGYLEYDWDCSLTYKVEWDQVADRCHYGMCANSFKCVTSQVQRLIGSPCKWHPDYVCVGRDCVYKPSRYYPRP